MMQHLLPGFRVGLVVLVASALAQAAVVVGTGNPDVDIPAVKAAVNLGGDVVLMGHFSFDKPPTVPTGLQAIGIPQATILIAKPVAISGSGGASIESGTIPFYVEAPGAAVTIQNVRFVLAPRNPPLSFMP